MKDRVLKLIKKYKKQMKEQPIMDDYDGGKAAALSMVIEDLEIELKGKKNGRR